MQGFPVYLLAALASICLFGCSGRPAAPEDIPPPPAVSDVEEETGVTVDTKIADVMADPVFEDYGRLLFPVQSSYYSGETLGELHLTWYTHINTDKTVEIVNSLRNRAAAGETVFYDIYTDGEKAAGPARWSCSTPATANTTLTGNRPPMSAWGITTASPTGGSWSGGSRRCPPWGWTPSSTTTPAWATASVWAPGRRRRAGSMTR